MTTSTSAPAEPAARPGGAFAELSGLVRDAGLLDHPHRSYAALFTLNAVMLAGGVAVFVWVGPSWWQMLTAAWFAVVSTQLAFVGHDAGHRQIVAGRRFNELLGHLHGGLVGLSFGAWVAKHNQHHAHPNHADDDPDIDIPVLAFGVDQAAAARGPVRWIVSHQAVLFVPLLLLEGWSLHVTAAQAVLRRQVPRPRLETGLLAGHVLVYLGVVFWVLSPLQAVVFVVVHQGLWGLYMGLAFAPNHKGMPIIEPGRQLDHLHKQVLTRPQRAWRTVRRPRAGRAEPPDRAPPVPADAAPAPAPGPAAGAGVLPAARRVLRPGRPLRLLPAGRSPPARRRRPAAPPGRRAGEGRAGSGRVSPAGHRRPHRRPKEHHRT